MNGTWRRAQAKPVAKPKVPKAKVVKKNPQVLMMEQMAAMTAAIQGTSARVPLASPQAPFKKHTTAHAPPPKQKKSPQNVPLSSGYAWPPELQGLERCSLCPYADKGSTATECVTRARSSLEGSRRRRGTAKRARPRELRIG